LEHGILDGGLERDKTNLGLLGTLKQDVKHVRILAMVEKEISW
jgi:hypothetical protein